MQHLAKVHSKSAIGGTQLQLMAVQVDDYVWKPMTPARLVKTSEPVPFNEQALVLVELEGDEAVTRVQDATGWLMDVVAEYLSLGFSPRSLEEELERAEQWRQSLTLQSQEVRRRALETAARRDEIQNLEKRLKLEREALESKD